MIVKNARIKLYAPFCHSLKEKRMVVKSILAKVKNKFNVSVAEVDDLDLHQSIIIGIACVSNSVAVCDSLISEVIKFIDNNFEAEIVNIDYEV